MKIDFNAWIQKANKSINHSIADCFNTAQRGGWQENHITTQILNSLMALGIELDWEQYAQRTKWEAYKLAGSMEYSNGDIGLIVNIKLSGDTFIKGVAFYEAKKQYFDEKGPIGFKAIKSDQLDRIRLKTHASSVLFYDVEVDKQQACATSVPTVFVKELAKKGLLEHSCRVVLNYGNFWILSLGDNLRGFSLDYQEESVKALEDYVRTAYAPSVLLNVGVDMINILEPELDGYCSSLDNYERIATEYDESLDPSPPKDDGPDFR